MEEENKVSEETEEIEVEETPQEEDEETKKKHERLYKTVRFLSVFFVFGAAFLATVYQKNATETLRTVSAYIFYAVAVVLFILYIIFNRGLFTGDVTEEYLSTLGEEEREKTLAKEEKRKKRASAVLVFLLPLTVVILADAFFQLILANYQ